jgi:ankyrin repeat protein
MARKGSRSSNPVGRGFRRIVVRGEAYRWKGASQVTVERLDRQGSRLEVRFDLHHAEPRQVASAIVYALDHGWNPAQMGKPFLVPDGNATLPGHPLWQAVEEGRSDEVAALLVAGADPNTQLQGRSVLHLAVTLKHEEVVQVLLAAGADPDGRGERWPPLATAAGKGWVAITRRLLEGGANINGIDAHGRTALWRAENNCFLPMLERGEPGLRQTKEEFEAVVRLLQEAGAAE